MADKKQLARLKKGVDAWNKWREENPNVRIRLNNANLAGANLVGADLGSAVLEGADLSGANLTRVNLNGADLERANLDHANLEWGNLGGAHLYKADLGGANLEWANLRAAYLAEASVRGANLERANLFGANFGRADLGHADLREANLRVTHCSGANLEQAYFHRANFSGTDLSGANLERAIVSHTSFDNVDLSQVKGIESVLHDGPSTIGIDTIYESKGNIPEVFLRGCGVPEDMIAYIRSLRGKAIDFYSCFISHSAQDKKFCERLYADLQANGVRTWYFPEDAKWGETVWGEIDRSIKIYDKLVVVLSENSLQSKPVLREIQRSLDREDKEHKNILFPIRIDDYVFDKWEHERKADVKEKVVGDFSGWDKDAAKYDKAFDKLLRGLQAESEKK